MWKRLTIAVFAVATISLGQEMRVYERGVIVNIEEDTSSSLYQGTSHTEYLENYWVRVGDIVYKGWCRDRLLHGCNIGFTIGDGVEVRFEKGSMFLKRSNGKEQKTNIEKRIKVNSQTEDALSQARVGLPNMQEQQPEATKAVAEQQNKGRITIISVPENAEISVDNEFVGNSPATLRLATGRHTIAVSSDGFKAWVREIAVLADSELTLNAKLEKGTSNDPTTKAAQEQLAPVPEDLHNPDPLANLPSEWTFPGGKVTVNIELKGDYLYEHQDYHMKDGRRRQEDCETRKDGARWIGKCHEKIWPKEGGGSVECSWELDEVITSVSRLQITGESQESLPPGKGKLCPTPANSMVKFVNVPRN